MENGIQKTKKETAMMENGFSKNFKDSYYFHSKSKLHKEFCPGTGFVENLWLNIKIAFEFFLLFLVGCWAFLIWFVGLFMCTRRKDVSGQLALITGGANGFGRELCLRFALEGCDIAIVDVDLENAKIVAKDIRQITTATVKEYKVDVSKPQEIEELKQKITEDFGRSVDILVNNAGIMSIASFDEKPEIYQKCIDVNLMGHIWMIRAFLPAMISNSRGHIVAVSSEASYCGGRFGSIYCSSKAAVRALMESLKDDLNMRNVKGVHTSCVMPYFLATEAVQFDRFTFQIPPLCPDKAAKILVDNVLKNNICFTIPGTHIFILTIIRIMPEVMKFRVLEYIVPRFLGLGLIDESAKTRDVK